MSNFDDYEFKVSATLLNRDDETEVIELGQLSIDPFEYFENSKYEIGYYDVETEDKTCEQNVVFKNTNSAYLIGDNSECLFHKYDETKENILFSSFRFDE